MMKKRKPKPKAKECSEYYQPANILDDPLEESVEFSLDDQLLRDILSKKGKRKLQEDTIQMGTLQVRIIWNLATTKSLHQIPVRHWLSGQIRKELNLN